MKVSYIREPQSIRITIRWRKPNKMDTRAYGRAVKDKFQQVNQSLREWAWEQVND